MVQLVEQEGYAHLLIQERISHDMVPYRFKASMNHLIMQDATTQGDFVAEVLWVMAAIFQGSHSMCFTVESTLSSTIK